MMTRAWLFMGLVGCTSPELVGSWKTERPSLGVTTELTFGADGWVVNRESDPQTSETVRYRWRVERKKLRQETADAEWDSATDFAVEGERMTLTAFRAVGERKGMVGKWRFEREEWAKPGTADRVQIWEMVFGATGTVGLSERYEKEPVRVRLGTWSEGDVAGSYFVDVDGEDLIREEYVLLGEVLAPAEAVFRRVR